MLHMFASAVVGIFIGFVVLYMGAVVFLVVSFTVEWFIKVVGAILDKFHKKSRKEYKKAKEVGFYTILHFIF